MVEFKSIKQQQDEKAESFMARLKCSARRIDFKIKKMCECGKEVEVDYTEDMVKDEFITGLLDEEACAELMKKGVKKCRSAAKRLYLAQQASLPIGSANTRKESSRKPRRRTRMLPLCAMDAGVVLRWLRGANLFPFLETSLICSASGFYLVWARKSLGRNGFFPSATWGVGGADQRIIFWFSWNERLAEVRVCLRTIFWRTGEIKRLGKRLWVQELNVSDSDFYCSKFVFCTVLFLFNFVILFLKVKK